MLAVNIMTTDIKSLKLSDTLIDVLEVLRDLKIRQVPILDNDNKVIGVITAKGVLKTLLPQYIASGDLKDVKFAPELQGFVDNIEELKNTTVADIVEKEFSSVSPETSTMEVATLFVNTETHLESILVVDDEERLLGVISPIDVYRRLWEYADKKKNS